MRAAWPLLILSLAACSGEADKDTGTDGATFTSVYSEVISPSCELAGCHAAPSVNGMELDGQANSYDSLVDADSLFLAGEIMVIPGDSDNSYLIKKLEGATGIEGDPMPPPFGGVAPEDIQLIRDWIDAGALDD